jgi:hypothetical protein
MPIDLPIACSLSATELRTRLAEMADVGRANPAWTRAQARRLLMALRAVLVGIIIGATTMFVVGTAIERSASGEFGHHDDATKAAPAGGERGASGEAHSEAGETPAEHVNENAGGSIATTEEPHAELRPLGIDIEAWPFVTLAAVASLSLAAAAWLRPGAAALLLLVAAAMLAFAAFDVREVVHQLDIEESGLAVLAGAIAALHAAAAVAAAAMASRAGRPDTGPRGPAGTMPA